MQIERKEKALLGARIEKEPRRFIQVISGPRQVGKTTMVQQYIRQARLPVHFASADLVAAGRTSWISQQWEAARVTLRTRGARSAVLVIDEIQKIGNWSEAVKKEWDADTLSGLDLKVVLLGSSRLLLQEGLTESLAGRFETIHLGHWSYTEMREAFAFTPEQYVWFGGYPGAAALTGEEERWKRYIVDALIETSISKDILMLTRVDKPALLKRLFELGCSYSGQILSFTKIMGQLQDAGNTTTLAHYLRLLDSAGLLKGLDKYSRHAVRQRASSPKFQVHNTALMSALEPRSFEEVSADPASWGRWVESAVGSHLLHHAEAGDLRFTYWRQGDLEVDFVLEHRGRSVGIEVKGGKKNEAPGMEAFARTCNPWKVLLVGEGGLGWQEFLELDPRILFD
ncbi:ATP-binding protein [Chlorobium sp. N1]|uniref:ATP-binding protein n=1 Tax=Chlorobium sp. N1 TaxID=2491138 RepID=UPI00103EF21F|nr:ATP-binding protein [Chlorobium sp. N1]TCD47985.1 ATP-binding protein [Chlorobium sp. N1]